MAFEETDITTIFLVICFFCLIFVKKKVFVFMMMLKVVFSVCVLIMVLLFIYLIYHEWNHDRIVTRLAEKYTLQEIEKVIKEDTEYLKDGHLKGVMLKGTSEHLELWNEVKKRKLKLEEDKYEDIVS